MKLGNAWTNEKDGRKYISIALDEVILETYPQLKQLNFSLNFIPKEERKTENSPSWSLSVVKKKDKTVAEEVTNEEEIPE